MNFSKKALLKIASKDIGITANDSKAIFESFLFIIKNESKSKTIKLSGFGVFKMHQTPKRLGRNPKTKKTYIINPIKKINFKASNKLKRKLN